MRRPSPMGLLAAMAIVGCAATGIALAASLGVTAKGVTVHTTAVSISPTTCTLNAANADSHVSELLLLSNFGTTTTLDVKSALLDDYRTFVLFDLSTCSIPANALVTAASLELYLSSAPTASRTLDAHRVTAAWTETGVTWSTQPATAASATASVATGTTSNIVLIWNVATDAQAFVDGTSNYGWRLKDATEDSVTSRLARFRSAEHGTTSERPVLRVTYYP